MPKKRSSGSRAKNTKTKKTVKSAAKKKALSGRKPPTQTADPLKSKSGKKSPLATGKARRHPKHVLSPVTATASSPVPAQDQEVRPAASKAPDQEWYTLPLGYGDVRVVLMVRDPWWLYAYWEVNDKRWRDVTGSLGRAGQDAALVLRVSDVTDVPARSSATFDVDVDRLINNWYFRVPTPDRAYQAELGLRLKDGTFVAICRSNIVRPPRDGVSPVVDEEWMISNEQWEKLYHLTGGERVLRGSEEWTRPSSPGKWGKK